MTRPATTGRTGPRIAIAAIAAALCGILAFALGAPRGSEVTVVGSVRAHDQVVNWPNHAALQQAARTQMASNEGQLAARQVVANPSAILSVEAKVRGNPASVDVIVEATNETSGVAAAEAGMQYLIDQSYAETTVPVKQRIKAMTDQLAELVAARDQLVATNSAESSKLEQLAGTIATIQSDLVIAETKLAGMTPPLVLMSEAAIEDQGSRALRTALATTLGAFILALLSLSLFAPSAPLDSGPAQKANRTKMIDLSEDVTETADASSEPLQLSSADK